MKKYYLHNGTEQQGPFSIDELKQQNLSKETHVWYDGLPEWTPAGQLAELKEAIKTIPPPFTPKPATEIPIAEKPVVTPTPIKKVEETPVKPVP
eukprot:gene12143-14845_t